MTHSLILSVFTIALGCYLIAAYSKISQSTQNYPSNSSVSKANQGLYTLGIIFIVSGGAFTLCNNGCGSNKLSLSKMYVYFFLLLGIVLTALSGTIIKGIDSDNAGKKWAIITLVMGIVFIVLCGALIGYEHKEKIKSYLPAKPPVKETYFPASNIEETSFPIVEVEDTPSTVEKDVKLAFGEKKRVRRCGL